MRRAFLVTLLLSMPAAAAAQADSRAEDREAVRAAVLDYVEAIYRAQPERVERSVRPDLAKVGYYKARDAGDFSETRMTYEELLQTARTYNRSGRDLSAAPRLITVMDVLDRVASAKLVATWGIDYFHLVKDDGRWRVLHVVWQSHTPETAQAAREEMARPGEGQGEGTAHRDPPPAVWGGLDPGPFAVGLEVLRYTDPRTNRVDAIAALDGPAGSPRCVPGVRPAGAAGGVPGPAADRGPAGGRAPGLPPVRAPCTR